MPFLLLMLLSVTCLVSKWPQPIGNLGLLESGLLAWALMAGVVAMAALTARRTRRRLLREPEKRESIVARYSSFRLYHLLAIFIGFGAALYFLGWGWVVQTLCQVQETAGEPGREAALGMGLQGTFPGAELLLLAPFFTALVFSWFFFWSVERTLHDTAHPVIAMRPFWNRWGYVGFHVRQNLALVLVPVSLLILLLGTYRLFPALYDNEWFQRLAFGCSLLVLMGLPWVLRLVLGLRPLPAGPLRDRLMTSAGRLNFRCSDILLWNTQNGVANALVVGLLPWLRYVVFTDRLIADMTSDEVDAVFGHEVGHVKHHHIQYYLGFLFASLGVLAGAFDLVARLPGMDRLKDQNLTPPLVIGSLGLYIFVVFGFLSRRCERQADIYGCRAVSCNQADCTGHEDSTNLSNGRGLCRSGIRIFIQALEKVAILNGISRTKPGWLQSWQHSTIARRVEFLQAMLSDPTLEARFQRRVRLVKWGLILGLVTLLGLFWSMDSDGPAADASPSPPSAPSSAG